MMDDGLHHLSRHGQSAVLLKCSPILWCLRMEMKYEYICILHISELSERIIEKRIRPSQNYNGVLEGL